MTGLTPPPADSPQSRSDRETGTPSMTPPTAGQSAAGAPPYASSAYARPGQPSAYAGPRYPGGVDGAPYRGPLPPTSSQSNGMAVASLVLSIAGISVLPLVGSILGVIFGHISLGQLRQTGGSNGMATAGLVIGYLGLALVIAGILFVSVMLVFVAQGASTISLVPRIASFPARFRLTTAPVPRRRAYA